MTFQHKELAAGRWQTLSFFEQMANIGSEVERALNWKIKDNAIYCHKAAERALELLDLTIEKMATPSHFKELTRLREVLIDYFFEKNKFSSSDASWRKYFACFTYAARRHY